MVHLWFMVTKRNRRLSMLINDQEWTMLQSLADRAGITASDWVRMRIREAFESAPAPKRQKR
jgi:hypothetical protein